MEIDNHFDLPLPPAAAWPLLMDVPRTAACFPGASLIEQISADHYKGRVTVKLGPLTMIFAGNLRLENRDESAHAAVIKAAWAETKGRGNANSSKPDNQNCPQQHGAPVAAASRSPTARFHHAGASAPSARPSPIQGSGRRCHTATERPACAEK